MYRKTYSTETLAAIGAVLFNALLVASMGSKNEYFFDQFAYLWGPHAVIVCMALILFPRGAAIAAISVVLSLYLVGFLLWERAVNDASGLAWLGYFFSLPGAAIGAVVGAIYLKEHNSISTIARISGTSMIFTSIGLAANQALVCSTVMLCKLPLN